VNPVLLEARDVVKRFGGIIATNHVSLDVRASEIHALIGPNGAGKSTLISVLFGELKPDSGSLRWLGDDMTHWSDWQRAQSGLARSFQTTNILPNFTARGNVALAIRGRERKCFAMASIADLDVGVALEADEYLTQVGLGAASERLAGALSYGEQRHLEIAMALALKPQLVLLDEPMAGVGSGESQELTALIASLRDENGIAVLLVEHDMEAVSRLADRVTVLVAGAVLCAGSVREVRADPAVRAAYLGESSPL
jgi:branched-chain amino acid transport system ATP-binding protein